MDKPSVKLTIEPIPRTTWGINVRTMAPEIWDTIRNDIYFNAGYKCEVCGGKGSAHPVEAHESWTYRWKTQNQILKHIIALCPVCHACKHYHSQQHEVRPKLLKHMKKVNGWGTRQLREYMVRRRDLWNKRDWIQWRVDIQLAYKMAEKIRELNAINVDLNI